MRYDYNEKTLAARAETERLKPDQTLDINELFFTKILKYLNGKIGEQSVLDIGTGNGYVLSEIAQRASNLHCSLYGVDNSEEMVSIAQKNLGAKAQILQADANHLPFNEGSFNLVTAKNVTRINPKEIYRVLKPGGVFVFREYGPGKGLCEIASLFPGRIIRQRDPLFYANSLSEAGLYILSLESYIITRDYGSPKNLITIVKSFPFIENFSQADEETIIAKCHTGVVISDPFILVCRKE